MGRGSYGATGRGGGGRRRRRGVGGGRVRVRGGATQPDLG